MRHAVLAVIAAQTLCGCLDAIDPLDPQVGAALAPRCANQDSDPDNEVSFSIDLLPLFRGDTASVGCSCHLPDDDNPIGFEESGLDLSNYNGVRAGGVNSLTSIVVAGSPCDSVLWQKASPRPPIRQQNAIRRASVSRRLGPTTDRRLDCRGCP